MENFDDRRKAFENKYAHDLELHFKIEARAVRIFGLWVAEQMDLSEKDANVYADYMVRQNLKEPGFRDVFDQARKDLDQEVVSDHMLRTKIKAALSSAEEQFMNDDDA